MAGDGGAQTDQAQDHKAPSEHAHAGGHRRRTGTRTARHVWTGPVRWPRLTAAGLAVPLALVGLAALGTATALPTRVADSRPAPCATALHVVTAASYAPVVAGVAPALATGPGCAQVDVTVADGRGATTRVAEVGADVWIPDDASWAGDPGAARLAAAPAAGAGTVLATSPFYLVTDRDTARRVTDAGGGWLALAHLVTQRPAAQAHLVVRDPGGSGDGMLGAGAVGEAVWNESGMDASAEALAAALPVTRTVDGAGSALPEAPGEVGLVPEHALRHDAGEIARAGSVVLAPTDRTAVLRYTWLPAAAAVADPARAAALDRLARALGGREADGPLAAAGLRRPGGGPPPGVDGDLPAIAAPLFDVLGPHHVDHVLASWYTADRRSDVLVAVDVSGSMAARQLGTHRALIDAVKDGVGSLVRLLPDDARLTLWRFGTHLDGPRDWAPLLGATALDGTGRAAVSGAVGRLEPTETGTGLHDTILAAYEAARDSTRPGVPSHVVVFTDGHNEADHPTITGAELTERLTAAKDPARPVALTVVAFGGRRDAQELEAALTPVGGYVDALDRADQVDAAFIHAAAGGIHG
jgi:von Willebrand factor type A domain